MGKIAPVPVLSAVRRLILALAVAVLAGCSRFPPMPRGKPLAGVEKHKKYKIRYKRQAGIKERYEWFVERHITGGPRELKVFERTRSLIVEYCVGQTTSGMDKVFFYRRQYERHRIEDFVVQLRGGKGRQNRQVIDETTRDEPVVVSRNKKRDIDKRLIVPWYYAVAPDGQFGMLPGHPYHLLIRDSAAFLFPILPKEPVALGESWTRRTKVRFGQGTRPYGFEITMTGTLKSVIEVEGQPCAVLEYRYSGSFDTDRMAPSANRASPAEKVRHEVDGEGVCLWGLRSGRILWKDDKVELISTRWMPEFKRTQSEGRRKSVTRFKALRVIDEVRVVARLLRYDERMAPSRSRGKWRREKRSHRGKRRSASENP